jgi:serine/threonine-protein kinase
MVASVATGARVPSLAKYEVLEEIGHGGMASVYRARDPRLGRDVAIKVIHPHLRDSPEVAHRFVVEAQAVAKLRHPNIVEVFDVSEEADREQYLVVELLRGETLRAILKQHGALPPEVAAAFALELLAALTHAHGEGVVHRDVKPENVLVEFKKGEGAAALKVKLTDFGIAKLLDAKGVTSTGQVLGSPAHMAPEQIEGGDVDARSDVFGLGVLLYECMVGHLPFEGNNPAQVLRRVLDGEYPIAEHERPLVGRVWSTILDRALAHAPDDRFASAAAMREAIVKELERFQVKDHREEIATYLDDPEAYVQAHEKKMTGTLCSLADDARRMGRTLDAAADYNRALAYAPADPRLMRIVAGMHRADARARFIKRSVPVLLGTVAAILLAFGVGRWIRGRPVTPTDRVATSTDVGPSLSVPISTSVGVASTPSASSSAPAVASSPTSVHTTLAPASAPAPMPTLRTLTFVGVRPPAGVTMAVDDEAPIGIAPGSTVQLDAKEHTLRFACVKDVCDPDVRAVHAGKTDDSMAVDLKIKPATLLVDGDPNGNYGIEDFPSVVIKPGVPVSLPVRGYSGNWITVVDRAHPDRKEKVELIANQQKRVTFSP